MNIFPESAYILNTRLKQYVHYRHAQGKELLKIMIKQQTWSSTDEFLIIVEAITLTEYIKSGYKKLTDLNRAHSA